MPEPSKGENLSHYLQRFMRSDEAEKSFPKSKQRYAVAMSMFKKRKKK
jgi:hypothetical protein